LLLTRQNLHRVGPLSHVRNRRQRHNNGEECKICEFPKGFSQVQKHNISHDELSELYHLHEHFFNIWYLIRLAPVGSQTRIIWLVRFLESWYSRDELVQRARKHIEAISKGGYHPMAAYYITEALTRTAKLDIDTEHELISTTKKYLLEKDKTLVGELSLSDKELLDQGNKYLKNAEYDKALKLFSKSKNRMIYFLLGYFLVKSDDNEKSKTYLAKAA
ncbi:MAG: hypothetical protein GY749_01665, partial [Desulfobacteraceae bacterium]|nr:hypothetical protein [Desulfobacteraceae bacterium]